MVLIVMFLPQGIVPALQRIWERKFGSGDDVPTRNQGAQEGDARVTTPHDGKSLKARGADA